MAFAKIKNFVLKKSYDFGRSDATLPNFHPQIYKSLAALGIFFTNRHSYLRFCIPLFSVGMTCIALSLEGLNIYHGVTTDDYSTACESFCYLVIVCTITTVYAGFLMNRKIILRQIREMEQDFVDICNLGPKYREPFLEGQLLVWKLFCGWTIFIVAVGITFFLLPFVLLIHQRLVSTQDENTNRPLSFPLWLPKDDPYRSPNYEMLFTYEGVYIICFDVCFCSYVYTLFHLLLHYYTKMDMIILDLKFIFDGLDESVAKLPRSDPRRVAAQMVLNKRLKRIVTWHISVYRAIKTVSSVFRTSLVYQMTLSSVVLCLISYKITEKLDKREIDVPFTMLGSATVLQLWIPCYLGTILRNKGFEVGDACWSCGWYETPLGCMIRTDILMILMRAQKPIFIKYTGQPVIQLETFSAIMSTSYTYFNMLRQSAK